MMRWRFAIGVCFVLLASLHSASGQEIKPFVSGSFKKISSAHRGKPFILNFWSLSCSYCMTELEMLGRVSRKHPRLNLVLVSADTPEEQEAVLGTLTRFSLNTAEAWVFADSYTERLRFEVDKKWMGELPRTYFFNSTGEVKAVSGEIGPEEVERWAKEQYSPH